jgi:peroxiredoxin
MSNKNAATENSIGKLHKLITDCHTMKLDAMLDMAKGFEELGALDSVIEAINTRDISAIQKWVEYNGVTAIAANEDGESELSKKLNALKDKQKGKVISFREAGNE